MANGVRRSSCLYNGESIGIEIFYTLIDGKRINVDNGMLEKFRALGKKGELFCDCEAKCGSNVTIVASEKMLRRQHFRLKDKQRNGCTIKDENPITANSKIVLKCWLQDKIGAQNEEFIYGNNINKIFDSDRKFQLTYFIKKISLGLVYNRVVNDINEEKMDSIEMLPLSNCIYVCDINDMNNNEQYPEFLIKVQKKQGFCLFLDIKYNKGNNGSKMPDYLNSRFAVTYCEKKVDTTWDKMLVLEANLSEFDIDNTGNMVYRGIRVIDIVKKHCSQKEIADNAEHKKTIQLQSQAIGNDSQEDNNPFCDVKIRCQYCGAYNVELEPAFYNVRVVCKHFKCQKESYIRVCPNCKSDKIYQKKFRVLYGRKQGMLECHKCGYSVKF